MSSCLVKDLLNRPFSTRSFSEKTEILKQGKPTPALPNLVQKSKTFTRHFQVNSYEKHDWLCGSVVLNAVFCWNCLLFGQDRKTSWTKTGFSHLGNLVKSMAAHEITVGHLRSSVSLASFGKSRIDVSLDEQLKNEISAHNKKVKCNRDILKRLINAVCFLGKQELAFRGHDESETSVNRGNYIELLKYTAEYDPLLSTHLESATVFKGISNRIQNDIVDAVASSLLEAIKSEVSVSKFVAVLVDETTDVSNNAQFSIVLRYVYDGEIKERFVGFCDISSDRHAPAIAELITQFLAEFDCSGKLIAQAYDGAAVMAGHLNGVQALIKNIHPEALFIHCYAHVLNLVLSQTVCKISECKVFFSSLSGLAAFFSRSPKRVKFLDQFLRRRLPSVSPTRWNYSSRLVNTVCRNRNQLCEVFNAMLNTPDEIQEEVLAPVSGFLSLLEEFSFCFFLNTFDKIFSFTDVLFNILQKQACDIAYCRQKIYEIRSNIVALKSNFDAVYEETVAEVGEPSKRRNVNHRMIFDEIFDTIDNHLETRFEDYQKLKFLALLSKDKFKDYKEKFPEEAFTSLFETYGKHFDDIRLKNELIVIFSSPEFQGKNLCELAKFLNSSSALASSFPQTVLLVELICTIPISTATVERSFSTLKRIKTYSRNTTGEKRLSNLAIISFESRLLESVKNKKSFFEKTVSFFATQERRLEFHFR